MTHNEYEQAKRRVGDSGARPVKSARAPAVT